MLVTQHLIQYLILNFFTLFYIMKHFAGFNIDDPQLVNIQVLKLLAMNDYSHRSRNENCCQSLSFIRLTTR